MPYFSRYDAVGRILHFAEVPSSMLVLQDDDIVYGIADPETEYVLDRTIVPRPPCPASFAGSVLTGLPVPCTLTINGQVYDVTEATVTLDFPHPGLYEIRVACWPYLNATFSVRI